MRKPKFPRQQQMQQQQQRQGQGRDGRDKNTDRVTQPRNAAAGVRQPDRKGKFQHRRMPFRRNRMDKRSEEHTSELQSLMRISYAVFCLKKKKSKTQTSASRSKNYSTEAKHKEQ